LSEVVFIDEEPEAFRFSAVVQFREGMCVSVALCDRAACEAACPTGGCLFLQPDVRHGYPPGGCVSCVRPGGGTAPFHIPTP